MTHEEYERERVALVRGLAALYRAAVLEVLMNRRRWSSEAAVHVADEVEAAVRASAAAFPAVGQTSPATGD